MKIAVVRVRGDVRITHEVRDTMRMLNLEKKNHLVVIEESAITKGMLHVISPFVTWGPIDDKVVSELKKKGEKVFRLNPPRKGYGRKGVKVAFRNGGAVGSRGDKMTDLVLRMM